MALRPYTLLARFYDQLTREAPRMNRHAREKILGRILSRIRTVCDLGCGTGTAAIELARRGLTVYAVDLSPAMCRQARPQVRPQPPPAPVRPRAPLRRRRARSSARRLVLFRPQHAPHLRKVLLHDSLGRTARLLPCHARGFQSSAGQRLARPGVVRAPRRRVAPHPRAHHGHLLVRLGNPPRLAPRRLRAPPFLGRHARPSAVSAPAPRVRHLLPGAEARRLNAYFFSAGFSGGAKLRMKLIRCHFCSERRRTFCPGILLCPSVMM